MKCMGISLSAMWMICSLKSNKARITWNTSKGCSTNSWDIKQRWNHSKSAFEVTSRKFLGIVVRYKGIERDPSKINAIIKLPSPRNLREHSANYKENEKKKRKRIFKNVKVIRKSPHIVHCSLGLILGGIKLDGAMPLLTWEYQTISRKTSSLNQLNKV